MAFERDLGYLDKFFDGLDAHAATLGGESGARLKQLIGEERTRWGEIRSLLGGPSAGAGKSDKADKSEKNDKGEKSDKPATPKVAAGSTSGELHAVPAALTQGAPSGAKSDVTAAATRNPGGGFTVGSLRGR